MCIWFWKILSKSHYKFTEVRHHYKLLPVLFWSKNICSPKSLTHGSTYISMIYLFLSESFTLSFWHIYGKHLLLKQCSLEQIKMGLKLRYFWFWFLFGHASHMWKFSGQGSNPGHSSDLSHSSDSAGSLASRPPELMYFK